MVRDMTRGSVTKAVFTFFLSYAISSILSYLYSTTDAIMVGRFVGQNALGAISAIIPIVTVVESFISSTISGFAIITAKKFGEGELKVLSKIMANSVLVVLIVGIPISVGLFLLTDPMLAIMNVSQSFTQSAKDYYTLSTLFMCIRFINALLSNMLRSLGDNRNPVLISICCGAMNVFFNYLFMGIIPLGVAGAALGTVCSSLLGMVIYYIVIMKKMPLLRFKLTDMKFDISILKMLLISGIPLGLLSSITAIGSTILQRTVNGFSDSVVTGISTGNKMLSLIWTILFSFESTVVFFASQNYGAGKIDRIKKSLKIALIFTCACGGICTLIFVFAGEPVCRIFLGEGNDSVTIETIRYAREYLLTQIAVFPFMAALCSFRGTVKGLGVTGPIVICGILELISRLCVSLISTYAPLSIDMKLDVLYLAGPLAWVITDIFLIFLYVYRIKKIKNVTENKEYECAI